MKIYNTLSRKKEEFRPIENNKVKMYVCGPTVYNYIHVGNARPLVFFDTVRRYMEYTGLEVHFAMNLTDIDDKIINRAIEEKTDYLTISEKYTDAFFKNAKDLNVDLSKINFLKATDHITDMIEFIAGLESKGAAYDTDTTVYFNSLASKDYGKLSRKHLEDLDHGSRVEIDSEKNNPMDFALWKKQKNENEPAWKSPWGNGRPGWHIECSAMAKTELGETIDIHGGGEDLQFPHHENEIAQSETLHDKPFANYWMHNSMVTVDKEKMSKSLNNFFTLADIEKEYDLYIVRMWLISSHYRSPLDFSKESLESIKNGYHRLKNTLNNLERLIANSAKNIESNPKKMEEIDQRVSSFKQAMDDDFNTANALASVFDLAKYINTNFDENSNIDDMKYAQKSFIELISILGIAFKEEILDEDIEKLIEERSQARLDKNFARADEIRDILAEKGISLKDTSTGVVWTRE